LVVNRKISSHGDNYEEHGLLGCNAVKFGENPTFRRNILPPTSGSKNDPSNKPTVAGDLSSLSLLFDPEYGGGSCPSETSTRKAPLVNILYVLTCFHCPVIHLHIVPRTVEPHSTSPYVFMAW
jgi:hypothetical protein